jgi:hypothetical protein
MSLCRLVEVLPDSRQVAPGRSLLDLPRERASELGGQVVRARERQDLGGNRSGITKDDVEGFLASFRVAGESAIPEPRRVVGHVDDPTRASMLTGPKERLSRSADT